LTKNEERKFAMAAVIS